MGKQRDDENLLDGLSRQAGDGVRNRGTLVAHGQLDGQAGAGLQFGLHLAADGDQRGARGGPDLGVGLGRLLGAGG